MSLEDFGYELPDPPMRIWTECVGEYLPLKGRILDVSEGLMGEDRYTFECERCDNVHHNAQALR